MSFLKFCTNFGSQPLPVTQDLLCSFVAYLANTNCAYQTIRSYLAAIRYLQIANNLTPTPLTSMHKLQLVMRGARRQIASTRTERPRLPITPDILRKLRALWTGRAHKFDVIMLWAACCTAFFGFFRVGEITIPSADGFDTHRHLAFQDIATDSVQSPRLIRIRLKHSKTDRRYEAGKRAPCFAAPTVPL